MKKRFLVSLLLVSVLFMTGVAQAIDMVPYMGFKVGKWNRFLVNDYCGNSLEDRGWKVASTEGYFHYKHYRKVDGSWLPNGDDIWQVTSTKLKSIGYTDGNGTWLYTPAIALPRTLALNAPYVYKGSVVNQNTLESLPVFLSLVITEKDIAVTTIAQSFTGCIKVLKIGGIIGDDFGENISFLCPGRGEVMTYRLKAEESSDPADPINGSVSKKDLKAFGNSKSPF